MAPAPEHGDIMQRIPSQATILARRIGSHPGHVTETLAKVTLRRHSTPINTLVHRDAFCVTETTPIVGYRKDNLMMSLADRFDGQNGDLPEYSEFERVLLARDTVMNCHIFVFRTWCLFRSARLLGNHADVAFSDVVHHEAVTGRAVIEAGDGFASEFRINACP